MKLLIGSQHLDSLRGGRSVVHAYVKARVSCTVMENMHLNEVKENSAEQEEKGQASQMTRATHRQKLIARHQAEK